MVIALVLTRSRMGNAGLMGALVLAMLIALIFVKELRKILAILVVSVIVVDTLIIGQWVGLDKVVERLENTEMSTEQVSVDAPGSEVQVASKAVSKPQRREESLEQRAEPAYNAINMVKDKPWTGFGAGTFYTAYPPYKNPNIRGFYEHAHNDYLEILADTGIVGASLLFAFALTSFIVSIKLLTVPRGVAKGVGFSVVLVLIALIFHSFVDFNLHIPPNAMTLMVLCALPWACRYLHNTR
jgi:putative inorganic carbon (hco3(-)) transporter